MRFFFIVVVLLLVVGFIGFTVTNLGSTATVTLWGTEYPDLPVWQVVLFAIAIGAALVGLLATVEGASIRLENRKLRKERTKMERELNFLRTTQPVEVVRPEPDALLPQPMDEPAEASAAPRSEPAQAPVYGPREDDDTYSGGRAV